MSVTSEGAARIGALGPMAALAAMLRQTQAALPEQCVCITFQCIRIMGVKQMLKSKVTARAQTTLPTGVRHALGLEAGDSVGYVIKGNQAVIVRLADQADEDPALASFLDFLERDMSRHPERLSAIPRSLLRRARALVRGVPHDPGDVIVGPVDL